MGKILGWLISVLLGRPVLAQALADGLWPYMAQRANRHRNLFSLVASDELTMKSGRERDCEYTLYRTPAPCWLCAYFDLTDLRPGDTVQIRLYAPVKNKELLLEQWEVEGHNPDVTWSIQARMVPAGARVAIHQLNGLPRVAHYDIYTQR